MSIPIFSLLALFSSSPLLRRCICMTLDVGEVMVTGQGGEMVLNGGGIGGSFIN